MYIYTCGHLNVTVNEIIGNASNYHKTNEFVAISIHAIGDRDIYLTT